MKWKRFYRPLPLFILVLLILGCASQRGGLTDPVRANSGKVKFDADNSQAVAIAPFYLVSINGDSNTHAWNLTLATAEKIPVIGFLKPTTLLIETFSQTIQDFHLHSGQLPTAIPHSSAGCQGDYVPDLTFSSDGSFSGTMQFTAFSDDCARIFDGTPIVSGKLDKDTGVLEAEFDFNALWISFPGSQYRVVGELELTMNAYQGEEQSYSAMLDMRMTNQDGVSYRMDDFEMVWNRIPEDNEIFLNGTLLFSEFGQVEIVTESPLVLDVESGLPYNGLIKYYGYGNSWVRLMFPRITYPGAFRINGSDETEAMGTLAPAQYE